MGEIPFVGSRPTATTVKAVERSLVMSIPQQELATKLQQDIGFTSCFYRAIATLLSHRLQEMQSRLGYGRRVYSKGLRLDEKIKYEDELNDTVLDSVALAGRRFDWMVGRLIVS